jgi:hypothetical protein
MSTNIFTNAQMEGAIDKRFEQKYNYLVKLLSQMINTNTTNIENNTTDIDLKEDKSNKVTSISGTSTDIEYPSAKLLYDELAGKLDTGSSLLLDQTIPQTLANGVPLMTTAVDEYGSGNQLVNKFYVDGGTWLMPPIIEWYDPTSGLPVDPEVGDRYGADATANGWTVDYIYEWDGDSWVESAPEEGWMLWDLFGLIMWVFFSGGWMEIGEDTFLKLDQTTPQQVTGGKPDFTAGFRAGGSNELDVDASGNISANNLSGTNTGDDATNSQYSGLELSKQDALTFGIANTNSLIVDDATAADNDYAKFTATGIEGVPYATVLSDIGAATYKYGNSSFTDNDTEQTFADAFCTATSLVIVSITGATPAGVWSVVSGAGSFTITSTSAESTDITFDYYIIKVG